MRPISEMSAFEACATLRRAVTADPRERWRLRAYAFVGRLAALRWARISLQHARTCIELGEGVDAIGWLLQAERYRSIAREYPERAAELARGFDRLARADARRGAEVPRRAAGSAR